jgi:hypothetical protein
MKPGGFSERVWRSRWSRILVLLVALILLTTPAPRVRGLKLAGGGEAPLLFTPIPFDAGDPARRDVGRLHFLGGWALTSPDSRLGGISGLHVENGEAIAVSDTGMILRFPLPGASPAPIIRFQPLDAGPGADRRRTTRDSEGLVVMGDRLWISFERQNMVWRYDRTSLAAQGAAAPATMRGWPGNSGPEAMVRLAGGRFLVIAEGLDDGAPFSRAALFAGDPAMAGTATAAVRYRRPPGYRPTDAALLPDGRILILNRRLSWLRLSAKLVIADVSRLGAGGTIESREVATLEAPLAIDNMEGLSVTVENGRTIVWIASDDDFMRLFRHSLLLKFELRL